MSVRIRPGYVLLAITTYPNVFWITSGWLISSQNFGFSTLFLVKENFKNLKAIAVPQQKIMLQMQINIQNAAKCLRHISIKQQFDFKCIGHSVKFRRCFNIHTPLITVVASCREIGIKEQDWLDDSMNFS